MKRIFIISLMCLAALGMQAQKCAVLDFMYDDGISSEDVDGISYIFRSNFHPKDYTIVERTLINKTIDELGYKRSDMTLQQILHVGRTLEASIIVVGNIGKFMDEYNVDVRVINVATGNTVVSDGSSFQRTDYRSSMKKTAKNIVSRVTNRFASGDDD